MQKPTTGQHYVWRSYLAAWTKSNTSDGQIMCLRDEKIFSVSLMKIAKENCFYGIQKLSDQERALIDEMMVRNTSGIQRKINKDWLELYCAPFDWIDGLRAWGDSALGHTDHMEIENKQAFQSWTIEGMERVHAQIEKMGLPYMTLLRQNSVEFWKDEADRDRFSFFLCNQYFRTKKARESILAAFEAAKQESGFFADIRPERMWLPLSLIFASNVGAQLAHHYAAVLLQADPACFIVGDQPVINTHSTFDKTTAPTDMELFYPVTPHAALLLTNAAKYKSGQVVKLSDEAVQQYNALEQRAAREMVFAKERSHLGALDAAGVQYHR